MDTDSNIVVGREQCPNCAKKGGDISQGPSADYFYDLTKEEDRSFKNLFNLMLARNHFGTKGKYYSNLKTQKQDSKEAEEPVGCSGGSCTL